MNYNFSFINIDGTAANGGYNAVPSNYPRSDGSKTITATPVFETGSPATSSLFNNVYKVEYTNLHTDDIWYITGSNPDAAANIVSGSVITGSLATVLFSFWDSKYNPESASSIKITPLQDENVGFNGSFVLSKPLYFSATAFNTHEFTINLVPQAYSVEFIAKGCGKPTPFEIYVSGSCTASLCIVSDVHVSDVITPKNAAKVCYTAQVIDAKFAAIATGSNAATASYANTASYATALVPTLPYTVSTLEADNGIIAGNASFGGDTTYIDGMGNISTIGTIQTNAITCSALSVNASASINSNGAITCSAISASAFSSDGNGNVYVGKPNTGTPSIYIAKPATNGWFQLTTNGNSYPYFTSGLQVGGTLEITNGGHIDSFGSPINIDSRLITPAISCSTVTASVITASKVTVPLGNGVLSMWGGATDAYCGTTAYYWDYNQSGTCFYRVNASNGVGLFINNAWPNLVGIGTSTPTATLDVSGSVNARGNVRATGSVTATGNVNCLQVNATNGVSYANGASSLNSDGGINLAGGNTTIDVYGNINTIGQIVASNQITAAAIVSNGNVIASGDVAANNGSFMGTVTANGLSSGGGTIDSSGGAYVNALYVAGGVTATGTTTLDGGNIITDGYGDLTVVAVTGDGSGLTSLTAANIVGTVNSASYALTASYALNGGSGGATSNYSPYNTVSTSSTQWVTCSFSTGSQYVTITNAGLYSFTSSNMPTAGQYADTILYIRNTATATSSLAFPATWKNYSGGWATQLTASKDAMIWLRAYDNGTIAGTYAVQN